ncbi:hypothetical protein [Streptomyces sp. SID3343]|uniref:hypothetical protein n=1 Tax=Streptomyces sp. SID3343 TaxID=2690260 RepID=UPI00136EB005|nr:hypothetical protein [Streptomyces sp. SID3343]MYW02015.1 hypothetical protein [Streptomyces sp. SID3343]
MSIPASDTVPAARVAPDEIGVVGRPPEGNPHTGRRARRWNAAMVLLPTVALAVLGWRHRALTDDGLIFLRTVRQILAGHGPVVNVDERIEANTSTLWQWILVGLGAVLPGDLGGIAVYAGLFLTTAGLAVALDATRRLYAASGPLRLLPAGVLVPLALPPFWDFATAGLDTGLGTLWLGGCWWLLVRGGRAGGVGSGEQALHAAWFGLGVLVRPDLALVTGFFLVGAWSALRPGWRGAGCQVAAAVAVPAAYEVFRMGYYGLLVPLPALTKEPGASEIGRGLRYAADFASPYWLYVPAVLLGVVLAGVVTRGSGDRARLAVLLTPLAAASALVVYVVRLGGDYMHARMLLPAMFLVLLPVLLVPARRVTAAAVVLVALWAVLCVGPWNPGAYHRSDTATAVRVRNTDIGITGTANPDTAADWVAAFPGLRRAVALGEGRGQERPVLVLVGADGEPGAVLPLNPVYRDAHVSVPGGYLGATGQIVPLDERIVEVWGLANTIGAHLEYPSDWRTKWPGHRKLLDTAWLLALDLDPAVTLVPPGIVDVSAASLAAARHALTCGALAELLASTREPLTPDRFLANLTGAVRRTTLRIPRDPFAAERRFCVTSR